MKISTLAFLAFYLTAAEANTNLAPILARIDERINMPAGTTKAVDTGTVKVAVPLDLAYQREHTLWNSISVAYDLMRSYDMTARHRFLYFAAKANARPHAERVEALKTWLKDENHIVKSAGMPKFFYAEWDKKVAVINTAIEEFETPYPAVEVKPLVVQVTSDDKNFLNEIKYEIEAAAKSLATMQAKTPATEVSWQVAALDINNLQYGLYLGALFVAFLVGFTVRRSKDNDLQKLAAEKAQSTPPALPELKFEALTAPVAAAPTSFYFDQGVNIEDECRKVIEASGHLLQMAQLKVIPNSRSPFKTSIDAPVDKVSESLAWLLKGTLAIANSNGGKVSHLEWHCREQFGRVSLEFTLHGLECDLKGLYLNTLVEGEASAPAHFGRSEMALSEHLASVGFKAGNKKTIISLGLDTLASNLSH